MLAGAALLGVCAVAQPQAGGPVRRIAVLMPDRSGMLEQISEGLRSLNYVDGRNITLQVRRQRDGSWDEPAAEIVALKPDIIITVTGLATQAVVRHTKTIPIVMASSADAVDLGLVASLKRPGGNVTGISLMSRDLAPKRLQYLRDMVPGAARVLVVDCPGPAHDAQWKAVRQTAQRLGVQLVPLVVADMSELPSRFRAATQPQAGIGAALFLDCSKLPPTGEVVAMVAAARLPALYAFDRYVTAGGLASYGPKPDYYGRSARFVDKILKGAKPGDIPVEQPTTFELRVNLKAAQAIGLTVPAAVRAQADQLIE